MSGENTTDAPTLEPPYTDVDTWLRAVHAAVATSLMFASILGNALVIWLVVKYRELQYRSILASMGAVIVNIIFSVVTNPQVLAGSITGEWPFGQRGCVAVGYISTSFFYVRWLNTCLIALDRFLYIMAPFFYQRNTKRILITLSTFVWTVPFLTNMPSAVEGNYSYRSGLTFCAVECKEDSVCTMVYVMVFAVYLLIGVIIPTFLYVFLYCFGKKKRRDMQRELGTQTDVENNPTSSTWFSSTQTPNMERYFPHARCASMDLASIEEENEGVELEERDPDLSLPSHQTSHKLMQARDLETVHEHKILDTAHPQNGRTLVHVSMFLDLDTKPSGSFESTIPENCRDGGPHRQDSQSVEDDVPVSLQRKGSNDRGSDSVQSPYHSHAGKRQTSIMVAALSAIVPGRHRTAIQMRERQAMITFVIIFISLVVTQVPLYILASSRRRDWYKDIPIWVHFIGVNLYFLAPVLEPIIIMRNKDFKTALSKMFRCRNSFSLPLP